MNYSIIYSDLMDRANKADRVKGTGEYYESHHVIPRCLGGSDDKNNLVLLSAREHFLAHWMLCRIYKGNSSIIKAFNRMCCTMTEERRCNSNKFSYARKLYAEDLKQRWKDDDYRIRMREAHKGQLAWNKGLIMDQNYRNKLSVAAKKSVNTGKFCVGHKFSEESKAKMSSAKLGKKLSAETRRKMSISRRKREEFKLNYNHQKDNHEKY
jgi:hypothetical protein